VNESYIKSLLEKYQIEKKDSRIYKSNDRKPDRESFLKYYQNHSIEDTCKNYGVGYNVLQRWIRLFNIKSRSMGEFSSRKHEIRQREIKPSYDSLKENYERMTIHELASFYSVDKSIIRKWLNEYDIEIKTNSSRLEDDIFEFCYSLDESFERNDRTIIKPLELDIVSKKHKLAIEVCGIYWHSDSIKKDRMYHYRKFDLCRKNGYKLLTIFESDEVSKVKSLIRTQLGKNKYRVYARETLVNEITNSEAKKFHNLHHLSGSVNSKINYGLFHKNNLVMVASFTRSRFSKDDSIECTRMTSHSDYSIVGGASKLFKNVLKDKSIKKCITYADYRFGEGKTYLNCGFEKSHETKPNYWYFKNDLSIHSRVKYQKHKLKCLFPNHYDDSLTEHQIMEKVGYNRIFDCGNAVYKYNHK
jgi:transposase